MYNFYLFKDVFWNPLDARVEHHPIPEYKLLWGHDFGTNAALQDWSKLTRNSKLLYIICLAQRMRHHELARRASWDGAYSLSLAHWNLAADLARLLENEMKEQLRAKRLVPGGTLGDVIKHYQGQTVNKNPGLTTPPAWAVYYGSASWPPINDTTTFNTEFPTLKTAIENPASTPDVKTASAVRLLNAARNQVAHKVDDAMVLFTDPTAAVFTVNVLLSLCHVNTWAN